MSKKFPESKHFTLERLTDGVYACVHKQGGGAYSNAGIIDLGNRTILVDAFDTVAAGRDLRQTAEDLFARPVDTIVLTHPHSDHWIGASAFDESTVLLSHEKTRKVSLKWGKDIMRDFQNPAEWEEWLAELEKQLETEQDAQASLGLENSIIRARYTIADMVTFKPRYADQTFKDSITFDGSLRKAEFRSLGRGHSENDAVILLPQDKIAFIGDIGFFNTQPFFGFCNITLYRTQALSFQESDDWVLVPGHGPVGNKKDIALQLKYFDVMEELVGEVIQRGGSFEEAMQISLPEPFDKWLVGGMSRFEVNVRYLFAHFGGEVPQET